MYQLKINDQSYQIPDNRNEVTLSRFLELRNTNISDTLSVIYWGIDAKPEFKESATIENELGVAFSLTKTLIESIYDFTESKLKNEVPDQIEVMGVTVELRKGLLNDLPYWPYVVTKYILAEELKKTPFDPTARYPEILAHYLYSSIVKTPYDENKASEFVEVINDIPFTEALQLGNFFLRKQSGLPQPKRKSFLPLRTKK